MVSISPYQVHCTSFQTGSRLLSMTLVFFFWPEEDKRREGGCKKMVDKPSTHDKSYHGAIYVLVEIHAAGHSQCQLIQSTYKKKYTSSSQSPRGKQPVLYLCSWITFLNSPCKVITVKGSLLEKRSTFGRLLALFTNTLNDILLHLVCPASSAVHAKLWLANQLRWAGQ